MNHECYGDYFTASGRRWYRCLKDSTIIPAPGAFKVCPNCDRPAEGTECSAETRLATLVSLETSPGQVSEFLLPEETRGELSMPGLPPLVIEKHRIALDGSEAVSFYACGPTRANRDEALADARRLAAKEENLTHG